MNELALFAGGGGGLLGAHMLGWRTVCAVEIELDCRERLLQRQREGFLPVFPIWDDVRTFDGRPWRGRVDIVTGGFPCTDISAAGKGAGIDGPESGLWKDMARIIGDVRPRLAWVENSPILTSRGLGTVIGDLAAMGYDTTWGVVSSADAGGTQLRRRIWILAHGQGVGVGARLCEDESAGQRRGRPGDRGVTLAISPGDGARGIPSGQGEEGRDDEGHADRRGPEEHVGIPMRGRLAGEPRRRAGAEPSDGHLGDEKWEGPVGDSEEDVANSKCSERWKVTSSRSHWSDGHDGGWKETAGGSRHGGERKHRAGSIHGSAQSGLGRTPDGLAAWMDSFARGDRPPVMGKGAEQFPWEPPRTCQGYKDRAFRIRAIGNGQDPWAMKLAFKLLSARV